MRERKKLRANYLTNFSMDSTEILHAFETCLSDGAHPRFISSNQHSRETTQLRLFRFNIVLHLDICGPISFKTN